MMDNFADQADIVKVRGPLSDWQLAVVDGLLTNASMKLRLAGKAVGVDIDNLIAGNELLTEAARIAVVSAVDRVFKNPDAIRSISTGTGPYTDTKTIDAAVSSGFVYISREDLKGWLPKKKPRARTIRIRSGFL